MSRGRGIDVANASHGEELLRRRPSDNTSATRGRDEPHPDRAALRMKLAGDSVGLAHPASPISHANRNDLEADCEMLEMKYERKKEKKEIETNI